MSGLHKLSITLSIELKTGLDYIRDLSLFDVLDICDDINELNKEMELKVKAAKHGK